MLSRYRETVRTWSDPVGRALFRLHLRPNHLTLMGLGVSLVAAAAFVEGHTRMAGFLLLLAGLFDFFDGSLARASGQVTPFGAFLDSVIDRYSDLVVLLGIVVLFARMPHARGALVAMAGLVGSVMVSYTKARAESIGVTCNIGVMERPERMICLIAGAVLDLLEPALWVLAVLANVTALQRIAFTRKAMRGAAVVPALLALLVMAVPALADEELIAAPEAAPREIERENPVAGDPLPEEPIAPPAAEAPPPPPPVAVSPPAPTPVVASAPAPPRPVPPATERAWAAAVAAYQAGDPLPLIREFGRDAALKGPIADYAGFLLAEALSRRGDVAGARAAAVGVADRHRESRLAPPALILAATLAALAGDETAAQALIVRVVDSYPDSPELPEALYLLGMTAEARGHLDPAAAAYRELTVLFPTTGWADGASDRLGALATAGTRVPQLSMPQRIDRAERLLRGGVPQTAADEAAGIAKEARDPGIVVRALKVVADASARLRRYDVAARALELAADRAPNDSKPALRLERARMLERAGKRDQALPLLDLVAGTGTEAEAAEAMSVKGRVLEDMNRNIEASALYRRLANRYPAREVAGGALWRLGWLSYLGGDPVAATQAWTRLAQIPGGRAYRMAALYWTARATEQKSGRNTAEPLYARVATESPRSYYGILAARRSAPREVSGELQVRLPDDPNEALAADPAFARVDLLRRIGLLELAWQEMEDVVNRSVGDTVRLYALSGTYIKEERYHMALRILRRHFAALATTGHASLPRAFWEMLYPFGWKDEVREAADRAGIDPFLVAAVVREESNYYPRALSRAGARGLMQLMPATAQPMARERGLAFRDGELLDEPVANLHLGATFLADRLKEFRDPRLALAAYNAGPAKLRQWWQARRTDDVEVFVEQIPFDETRQYVKRVMLSWDEYRRIYGQDPALRSSTSADAPATSPAEAPPRFP